jgi:hypothetical protein
MLASDPVATLNQTAGDLGIKIRFGLKSSRSRRAHNPEKLVLDLIGDGNRFPAGACARAGHRPDPSAKPAAYSAEAAASAAKAGSAGEGRSEKIMRKQNVWEAQ